MRANIDSRLQIGQISRAGVGKAVRRLFAASFRQAAAALILAAVAAPGLPDTARAAPGDNEIRIGNTVPYTGPASAYGVQGRMEAVPVPS